MSAPTLTAPSDDKDSVISPRDYIRRETLERIDHFLAKPKLRVYLDLKGMCERVSDSYRDRVVVELLQNAHDAHSHGASDGRIHIAFDSRDGEFGTLYVANDGHGFSRDNFDALCSPTRTTKSVNEAIGNKGIGFLSVFQVCSHPEVYSRSAPSSVGFDGYCFAFAADEMLVDFLDEEERGETATRVIANMPRLYLACPINALPDAVGQLADEGFATVIRLPLKSLDARQAVVKQLAALTAEEPPVQLFLSRIRELRISSEPDAEPAILGRDCEELGRAGDVRILRARCGVRAFIVAEKRIPEAKILDIIAQDIAAETLPDAWNDWTGDAVVSLAVAANGDPIEPRLYNFLPMGEGAHAPLSGYLDAPFFATLDRLRIQSGVALNAFLMEAAQALAVEGADLARTCLPREEARQAVLDLVLWSDHKEPMLAAIAERGAPLVPTIAKRGASSPWARLDQAKIWHGNAFLTAQFVARHAEFPIVDSEIGPARTQSLRTFVTGTDYLDCTADARAQIVEQVAASLPKPAQGISRWNQFYGALAELFRSDATALAGRKLLVNTRGALETTETTLPARGRKGKRRLSAMFLPPVRGSSGKGEHTAVKLPKAVQRRLAFVHEGLELATDSANSARKFLLQAGLVREHESREILRMLAAAIAEPGDTRDPETLRWEALKAMMRIVEIEDTADGVVAEINPQVPTREGWTRASQAYFARWPGTRGSDLEAFFDRARGLSAELDQGAGRLLRPWGDWRARPDERENWTTFLRKAGISDLLRPVVAFTGASPRDWPARLQEAIVQRTPLPPEHVVKWRQLMGNGWNVTNPQTVYSASAVLRLPGQRDFETIAPVAAPDYAKQLTRLLEAQPAVLRFTISRPHYPHAPNTRSWASPVAAFIHAAKWVPLADGNLASIEEAWLPGSEGKSPPPLLPLASLEFRQELARCPGAAEVLRQAGLAEFGAKRDAWRFLVAAGALITPGIHPADAERIMSAVQDAWLAADLDGNPPAGLRLVGRAGGQILSADPRDGNNVKFLIADGDDRQLLAASARADPATIVIDPPTARAREIAVYLAKHFPAAVKRASSIEASYESTGEPVDPNGSDPTIEEVFGDPVRQVIALALRYRCNFYRGNIEETLARLAAVRVRRLPALSLRVGDIVEPVPRFHERAILIGGSANPTVLYSEALASSDRLLVGLAPAIGAALGAQRTIGEPLLAFAAELGADPLSASYEDFAAVLNVPVEDVRGFLGAARASIGNLLRSLRPFVSYFAGPAEADRFVPGAGLVSEDDVAGALTTVAEHLPIRPQELLGRCRETKDLATIAAALQVDLAAFNQRLVDLGPPYQPVDLTERHTATLAAFLTRKEPQIRESLRQSFWPRFVAGENLGAYVEARATPRPVLPQDFGIRAIELTQAQMQDWLEGWMQEREAKLSPAMPPARDQLETVRDANTKRLRALAPALRTAILARAHEREPLIARWQSLFEAEGAIVAAANTGGWTDFDRLNDDQVTLWLQRSCLWPQGWPSLAALAITEEEQRLRSLQDERDRIAATTVPRQMQHGGGTFTFGVDALGSLADQISTLVSKNAALLATSSRTLQGEAPKLNLRPGGGGGSGGGSPNRMSDEERSLIGFFGETIAFAWLKQRYSAKRVIDERCWKSNYRQHVCGEAGDDSLGHDFEVVNGGTRWLFEVKSTTAAGPAPVQSLELGSTEFDCAEAYKADRRTRFRILYITNALHPEHARIFVLPNPRSRAGLTFFTDLRGGHRLHFPLSP